MFGGSRPKWWRLYALGPLMMGLLILESRFALSPAIHQALEGGIILVTFGLMVLWVHANRAALEDEEIPGLEWSLPSNPSERRLPDSAILPSTGDNGPDGDLYEFDYPTSEGSYN